MDKAKIVAEIRKNVSDWDARFNLNNNLSKGCLIWAVFTAARLKELGIHSLISAGSMSWPIEIEDGIPVATFTYDFEPDSADTALSLQMGVMPIMHVWVQIPSTKEVVDLTSRYLKQLSKQDHGEEWKAPDPPDFVWDKAIDIPGQCLVLPQYGAVYFPNRTANAIVAQKIKETWGL